MIAFNNERNEISWQSNFVAMLPDIEQKLRLAFCRLDSEAREDAMEEGVRSLANQSKTFVGEWPQNSIWQHFTGLHSGATRRYVNIPAFTC